MREIHRKNPHHKNADESGALDDVNEQELARVESFGEPEKILLVDDNDSKNSVNITNIKDTKAFIEKYKSE